LRNDMVFVYKMLFGLVDMNFGEYFFPLRADSATRGHEYKLFVNNSRLNRKHFFHRESSCSLDWIGLSSDLRPHQHSIGYMGDGFYRSKDPTNNIKVLRYI